MPRAVIIAAVMCPGTAGAQLTVTTDATVATGYVWRGVTYTNRPVAHTSGVSLGQAADHSGHDASYFAADGLAFAEAAAGVGASFGAVSVTPSVHLVFARDAAARVTAPDVTRAAKLWLGTTVTWVRTVGRAGAP